MIEKVLLGAGLFLGAWTQSSPPSPPPQVFTIPTRLAGASDPRSPLVRLPGFSFFWKEGVPSQVRGGVKSLVPPRFALLTLLGVSRPLLLLRAKPFRPGRRDVAPAGFPDTLALDLQGDGRFGPAERFPLRWERAGGLGRGRTREIRLGGMPFEVQVRPEGPRWRGFLFPHAWRVGEGRVGRWKRFFLYVDQNLDGRVGKEDLWLLAGPGDPRRSLRALGPEELREGNAPFPLEGGKAAFLERIDGEGRAVIEVRGKGAELEADYLAGRAARVRARWEQVFAVDDAGRRKFLGVPEKTKLGGVSIPWIHTTNPLPLWVKARPGRPVLFWVDGEESTECRRLEHYTLGADEAARLIAEKFTAVHVPLGLCGKDPRKAWGVVSLPALVVVGPSGKVLWKHEGFLPPGKLVRALEEALRKSASRK